MRTYLIFEKLPLSVISAAAFFMAGCAYQHQPAISGFRPVYPPLTATVIVFPSYWPKVDSLQPTLRWQPFPGEHRRYWGEQVAPFVVVEPASVRDVRYDLRIWTVLDKAPIELLRIWTDLDKAPGELAYEIEGLTEPFHKLERPLKPNAEYYWSVRARFSLDGQPRFSEWSLTQYPCGYHGGECARGEARQTGRIPPLNHYRFKTPRQ